MNPHSEALLVFIVPLPSITSACNSSSFATLLTLAAGQAKANCQLDEAMGALNFIEKSYRMMYL